MPLRRISGHLTRLPKLVRLAVGTLISCGCALGALGADPIESRYVFKTFGPEVGLSDDETFQVARDQRGFLWVAARTGLYKYDGYRFEHFSRVPGDPNTLSSNRLRSVYVDRQDRVWVGTENAGVSVLDQTTGRFTHYGAETVEVDDERPRIVGQVLSMTELADGSMLLASLGGGLIRVDAESGAIETMMSRDPVANSAQCYWIADNGKSGPERDVWATCLGSGPLRYDPETGAMQTWADVSGLITDFPLAAVTIVSFDSDGRLWLGTHSGQGLLAWDPESNALTKIAMGEPPFNLPFSTVTGLTADDRGRIWITTLSSGTHILDYDRGVAEHLTFDAADTTGIGGNNGFEASFSDGEMWLPIIKGRLSAVDLSQTSVVVFKGSQSEQGPFSTASEIFPALQMRDGRVLIAARDRNPAIYQFDGSRFEFEQEVPLSRLVSEPPWTLQAKETPDGRIWIPTVDHGVFVFDPARTDLVQLAGTQTWNVPAITVSPSGEVWAGTSAGQVVRINPDTLTITDINRTQTGPRADVGLLTAIAVRDDRFVWTGGRGPLHRFDLADQTVERFSFDGRLPSARTVLVTRSGLWAAGETVVHLPNPTASVPETRFVLDGTRFEGLSVTNLIEDDLGRIWMTTDKGLLAHDPATRKTRLFRENFGVPARVTETAIEKLADGRLAFAMPRSLVVVSPDLFDQTRPIRPPALTRVSVGGERRWGIRSGTSAPPVILQPGSRDISFEFASPALLDSSTYRYAYQLVGFDSGFAETDASRRTATYTNLPPGRYRLQLRTLAPDGRSADWEGGVVLSVLPAFYETWWFKAIIGLIVLVSLYFAYVARVAMMQRYQRQLQRDVRKRTAKIDEQRKELATRTVAMQNTLEQLRETQAQLVQSEKLAALGGLVAGVAHEVNTPVGLVVSGASQLSGEINALREKVDQNVVTRGAMRQFLDLSAQLSDLTLKNAQRAAELIQSFKNISADQASDRIIEVDIKEYASDVLASLGPMLREQSIGAQVTGETALKAEINAGALSQILTNLVTNAAAHAFQDDQAQKEIAIHIQRAETGFIAVTVSDNGKGVSEDLRTRIFEPFFTTRRGRGSSGLGLHIVHNLAVGVLGGTIELVPPPFGRGAAFKLVFPVKRHADSGVSDAE